MTQLLTKTTDQRTLYHDRTWEQFKLIQKGFEGLAGVRLFYFNHTIEVLMPGRDHEIFKTLIGYLIETFLFEKDITFVATGSMTQEAEEVASTQPDESYCIGEPKLIPDLAIEVIFTSGSTRKLERYKALGVPEVWFWEDGLFTLHHLRENRYERIYRSEIPGLTDLDIELLTRCVLIGETSNAEALKAFRQGINL